jgi:hypothetical protein
MAVGSRDIDEITDIVIDITTRQPTSTPTG